MKQGNWIWSHSKSTLKKEACFFRRRFSLDAPPQACPVQISADSIYAFYVNGELLCRGPQKSDRYRRYYDTVDIAPCLMPGENTLAAMACHFINDEEQSRIFETGPISVPCTLRGGFWLGCESLPWLSTDRQWRVLQDTSMEFVSPCLTRYATDMMRVDLAAYPAGFEERDYDDSAFQIPVIVADTRFENCGGITTWPLRPANLPQLMGARQTPARVTRSNLPGAEALVNAGRVTVPAGNDACFIELGMQALTTAHVRIGFEYGCPKPVSVGIVYAESYFRAGEDGSLYKGVRDEAGGAVFSGETDTAVLRAADGRELVFETVFFRTFRFIRLEIPPAEAPITIKLPQLREYLYPLEIQGELLAPAREKTLWDVSVNTLRLCMHATYEDCPYYEQMQYTMDTALQMKYTYQISTDDTLARNAIDAFSASRMPDGLVACNYPAKFVQVIPGFALYYVEMLSDHYMYFGDEALVKRYLCVADSVLQYFAGKLDAQTGLFPRSEYWEFVDWVAEWHGNFGVPISPQESINTVYHEMFIYFLRKAANLCEMVGRDGMAREYRALAQKARQGVLEHCYNAERGLFADTTGRADASAHAQLWAVLAGIVDGDEARRLMLRVLEDDSLPQCSYSMRYYLFRALEQTGLYARAKAYYKPWEQMLENHMTTWCEDPVTQRSDCHGWSSLPLYEYSAMLLGVKPKAPGYGEISIRPFCEGYDMAEGTVATVKGPVHVRWQRAGRMVALDARTPENVPAEVVLGESRHSHSGGKLHFEAEA